MKIFIIIVIKKKNFILYADGIFFLNSLVTHIYTQTLSRHAMWIADASNFAKIPCKDELRISLEIEIADKAANLPSISNFASVLLLACVETLNWSEYFFEDTPG